MFSVGVAASVQAYFLTQAVPDLDPSLPLSEQPQLAAITAQALQAADAFSAFIGAATGTLDIAIYDFRLLPGPLEDEFLGAIRGAARGQRPARLRQDPGEQ